MMGTRMVHATIYWSMYFTLILWSSPLTLKALEFMEVGFFCPLNNIRGRWNIPLLYTCTSPFRYILFIFLIPSPHLSLRVINTLSPPTIVLSFIGTMYLYCLTPRRFHSFYILRATLHELQINYAF